MAEKPAAETAIVRIGNKLSATFDRLQDTIRERAYQLFLDRHPESGDSTEDWLRAQSEILTNIDLKLIEQKKNVVVEADLKGFSPKEVEVEVQGDVLSVFGSHAETSSAKKAGVKASKSESRYFYQSLTLPVPVDVDGSTARMFKNGKLKVTLPKI